MKIYVRRIVFALLAYFLFSSCSNSELKDNYSSKPLNQLLYEVPIKKIDLDAINPSIIVPKDKDDIIGKEQTDNSSVTLGIIENAIALGDKSYLLDRSQNALVVAGENGYINSIVARPGRGPGEFGQIAKIFSNSQHIYLYDRGNSKIHLYNHNLQFEKSLILKNSLMKSVYEASNRHLFIPTEADSPLLIQALNPKPPFEKQHSLLPRLIPFGKQPFAYNNVKINGNNDIIAAAYIGLPFIFIFNNDFDHLKTLYFKSKKIDSKQSPPLKAIAKKSGTGIGVPSIFMGFRLLENNDLILSLGKEIYYLEASDDLEYKLIAAKYLHYRDQKKQKKDGYGINAKYIQQNNNYILVSSINENRAYKFNIQDITEIQ